MDQSFHVAHSLYTCHIDKKDQRIFDLKGADSQLVHGIYTLGKHMFERIDFPSLAIMVVFF